jgi:hypothetical protein
MAIQQSLRFGRHSWIGASSPDGGLNRLAGSPFESNVSRNLLRAADQSDIFDQQSSHPFPLPVWSFRILPHLGKVLCQSKNLFLGLRRYGLSGRA